jgi:alkylation response protein AidB-like acyl-CoA dehydrogenase
MVDVYGVPAAGRDFVARAAALARSAAGPAATEVDAQGRFPAEAIAALSREGLLGLCLPAAAGGGEQGPATFAAVVEELAQACASTAMIYVMHVSAAQAIAASRTLAGRDAILREIAEGRHLTTLAFSERGSRSQFWLPVSRLEEDGRAYVTNASKSWVTAAGHAASYVASAQAPGARSPLESVVYLVRRETPGVRVVSRFEGLGLRGNESAPVEFGRVAVRREDLLSEPGAGLSVMLEVVLPWFAVGTAAMAHGICRAALGATAAHLSEAGFETPGGKLRDLPNLRARLAEMSVRTEASRALLGHALARMASPDATTPLYILQARLAAIQAAVDVTDLALKTCGGAAFSRHLSVERLFRDARAGWVMAPTADHLLDFVGKALTGLPLF